MASIYSDVYGIVKRNKYPFNFFIGGRGIGKTYSCLLGALRDRKPIIYFRTNDSTIQTVAVEEFNPYKDINMNEGTDIHMQANKGGYVIQNKEDDELIGYAFAVSTFYKMRGTKFPEVKVIVYDEFLEDSGNQRLKFASDKFFHAYETINRNRELSEPPQPPVQAIFIANSFSMDNDILRQLNLIVPIQQLREQEGRRKKVYTDDERGIYLELMVNQKIADLKSKTALYKLTKGTTFHEMALANNFTQDDFFNVKQVNFNELIPLCSVGRVTYYRHKSRDLIYASSRHAQCERYDKQNYRVFLKDYRYYLLKYHDSGLILYQNYDIKLLSNDYLGGVYR